MSVTIAPEATTPPSATPGGPASTTRSAAAARERTADLEQLIVQNPGAYRVLTGDRPTGALHLGHLLGTVANRVRLQNLGVEMFLIVADYQVITDRDDAGDLPATVREVLLDYLAAGIDPECTTIFTHSAVPALNQLLLPFLSLVTVAELERNPTVKAESEAAAERGGRGTSGLLFTYPVHQAADILFCHGNLVPVGEDQLPHLEATRTVARRFNQRYSAAQPYFPEPDALIAQSPTILGSDGGKMSKSRGNALELRATEDETVAFFRRAKTDADRAITYEPERRPEIANLLQIGAYFTGTSPQALADEVGSAGAGRLKTLVTEAVTEGLRPLRARRRELAATGSRHLAEVLARGNAHANAIADRTLDDVRDLMGMRY
ncbi:tryptophanyl-tRNA synthetase [Promicromonospora umidemergens]|uniref:Tryptophan--tRNA ligase n=1 Tax=Promicromonospora umidemergens TaxID=629679 RepID=A0ABP8X261_9MICO|nr:tryptophan--tRNA ligase [Promicromonospora umidemergens]MCP2286498.1 tryptophanyl-tRNA synthetase [Promicromonospora umidemergens]